MDINYTIIIPHKDIPDVLQRCLDSIPQSEDAQVIVVDDNSDPENVNFAHFQRLDRTDVERYFTREGKGGDMHAMSDYGTLAANGCCSPMRMTSFIPTCSASWIGGKIRCGTLSISRRIRWTAIY